MSSVLEKLAAKGHLSEEQVERIGRRVAQLVKEAKASPQFMEAAKEKLALNPFLKKTLQTLGSGAVFAAGVTGGAMGVHMISDRIQGRRQSLEKAKHFKDMVAANPDLQGADVDSRMMQRHFDTLHKFNPEYASDPMIAGTYVHNSLAYARPNIETLNNVVKARGEHVRAGQNIVRPGESVLKPMGDLATQMMRGMGARGGQSDEE